MHRLKVLIITGLISALLYFGIWRLSLQFNWGEGYADRPILSYLALYFALFGLYAFATRFVLKSEFNWTAFWTIIVFGLLFRAAIFPAQQIQEDDVYRYLWDGKVFAHGINPYRYAPDEVSLLKEKMIRDQERLHKTYSRDEIAELNRLYDLKWSDDRSLVFMERINHPTVPTIYPPMAQYVFRAAYHIKPNSILTLRALFFGFDIMALVFIVLTLRALGMNLMWCIVYYWCPLVIKETFNSTHLDIIGIGLLMGSVYFLVKARFYLAHIFLALGVLGKLYPVILLPLFLKQRWKAEREEGESPWSACTMAFWLFAAVIVIGYLPFIDIGQKMFEGLLTYTAWWQNNDSLFAIILWFYRSVIGLEPGAPVGFSSDLPSLVAKITVALILFSVLAFLFFRRGDEDDRAVLKNLFIMMALVFLFSPVQNPWYLCWVVPFLCIFPSRAWIMLTGLVGFYYLDFYFDYQDLQGYRPWIEWVEYTPFYLLLGWEYWNKNRQGRAADRRR